MLTVEWTEIQYRVRTRDNRPDLSCHLIAKQQQLIRPCQPNRSVYHAGPWLLDAAVVFAIAVAVFAACMFFEEFYFRLFPHKTFCLKLWK
jgi:hypothetical protein